MARWAFYAILPKWLSLSKWLQHLLHKCPLGNFSWVYQPRPNNCPRHYVDKIEPHHTTPSLPPHPPPHPLPLRRRRRNDVRQQVLQQRRPTTSTSMPWATCPCLILRHWSETSRTGRLTVSAWRQRRRGTFVNFSEQACPSSKKPGSCLGWTPPSGGGGGKEARGIPGRGEEDVYRGRKVQGGVDKAHHGREEEEGESVGGRARDGVPGASSGTAGDGDGRGPDEHAADAPPLRFGEGGLSSRPPLIIAYLWTAMARTVGIRSRRVIL